MAETRKLAAVLAGGVAGYSKLADADEERTLARSRALRSDLITASDGLERQTSQSKTGRAFGSCYREPGRRYCRRHKTNPYRI
jgi:hypothetical protein